jgi:hypothetical protein
MSSYPLLGSNMCPCQLLLELVCLVALVACLLRLFEAGGSFLEGGTEVWQCLFLLLKNLCSCPNIVDASFVLLRELRELRAAKEELPV